MDEIVEGKNLVRSKQYVNETGCIFPYCFVVCMEEREREKAEYSGKKEREKI